MGIGLIELNTSSRRQCSERNVAMLAVGRKKWYSHCCCSETEINLKFAHREIVQNVIAQQTCLHLGMRRMRSPVSAGSELPKKGPQDPCVHVMERSRAVAVLYLIAELQMCAFQARSECWSFCASRLSIWRLLDDPRDHFQNFLQVPFINSPIMQVGNGTRLELGVYMYTPISNPFDSQIVVKNGGVEIVHVPLVHGVQFVDAYFQPTAVRDDHIYPLGIKYIPHIAENIPQPRPDRLRFHAYHCHYTCTWVNSLPHLHPSLT